MPRFKDFDAAEAERKGEPITFRLGGQEWTAAHVNAANFLAFSRVIAGGGSDAITGFDDYITSTLEESQRDAFHQMLSESEVSLSTLMEVGRWIVEQATGNPTADASPLPVPQSNTGKPRVVYSREKPQGVDYRDSSLRYWLIVFEALLRERMSEEQAEEFDAALDTAADEKHDPAELAEWHKRAGGEVSLL